jgi:hypothetical protein
MRMLQARGEQNLAFESLGAEDATHAASAELSLDGIRAIERGLQVLLEARRHGGIRRTGPLTCSRYVWPANQLGRRERFITKAS